MEIRNKEDLKKIRESLPEELVNHPAFEQIFDWEVNRYLVTVML